MADLIVALSATNTDYLGDLPTSAPGMTGEDVPLYWAWRAHPAIPSTHAFFNVRVGPQAAVLRGLAPLEARILAATSAPRIDLLLLQVSTWWILEFHGHAGLAQLGRVVCYPELLRETYDADVEVRSAVVSWTLNPFLEGSFTRRRIPVFVYTTDRPEPRLVNPAALI